MFLVPVISRRRTFASTDKKTRPAQNRRNWQWESCPGTSAAPYGKGDEEVERRAHQHVYVREASRPHLRLQGNTCMCAVSASDPSSTAFPVIPTTARSTAAVCAVSANSCSPGAAPRLRHGLSDVAAEGCEFCMAGSPKQNGYETRCSMRCTTPGLDDAWAGRSRHAVNLRRLAPPRRERVERQQFRWPSLQTHSRQHARTSQGRGRETLRTTGRRCSLRTPRSPSGPDR